MNYGFFRVACASPHLMVANCAFNAENIIDSARGLSTDGASLIVFPELCITAYTCGDLFYQKTLLDSALKSLEHIAKKTASLNSIILVGLPFAIGESLYNCGAILFNGRILALIPKTFIPNSCEFYEGRYFSPCSRHCPKSVFISEKNPDVPFGTDILVHDKNNPDFALAVEICEDVWVASPPSSLAALGGATVIANLSASNEIIGKAEYRKLLVTSQSARCMCAYVYADAGDDESSQDLVFGAHNIIAENGEILAEARPFAEKNAVVADIDLERIQQERRKSVTFSQCRDFQEKKEWRKVIVDLNPSCGGKLIRFIDPYPFVPRDVRQRDARCREVFEIQVHGLARRIRHIKAQNIVIGLSGGLDSTLALLVSCRAVDMCGIERSRIRAVTMPCFGTTDRTYKNACALAKQCGATLQEIRIEKSVLQHFEDIGQDKNTRDVVYENAQARERTQVLMDIANKINGIVVGTGDLSELALGWCTYSGDQMSMYGVNSSVPKTLVKYLVQWFSDSERELLGAENTSNAEASNAELSAVLRDILDTPVSPELLPPESGKISQQTEDIVGPYALHDFFLYYALRFGFSPAKILYLADSSALPYSHEIKLKWLKVFYRRFFSQQFKRSCMPDGAKVGSVGLSPRGDWRMPSDASVEMWLSEIEGIK